MRVLMLPTKLSSALDVAAGAIARRSTLPVLQHVHIKATPDGGVIVTGTDLETRAWHTVSAKVEEPGAVCLPPKLIAEFLDAINPDDALTLTVNEQHKAELVSGRTRVRLAGLDAELYPPCPDFSEPIFDTTMSADVMSTLIKSVAFAVAPDDSRPVLAGVLIRASGTTLQLVAADGYRLALRSAEVESPELDVIAQGKTLAKAGRMLEKATSARLLVDARSSALLVDSEAGCWSIRLLEGQFPDFNRIIPKDPPVGVTVDRADLVRAITLVRGVEQTSDGYLMRLTVEADSLALRAGGTTSDQEADTEIAATLERGKPLTVAFNPRYLGEAVAAIEGDRVMLELSGPASPALVRAAGERNGHLNVVMVMHDARGGS